MSAFSPARRFGTKRGRRFLSHGGKSVAQLRRARRGRRDGERIAKASRRGNRR